MVRDRFEKLDWELRLLVIYKLRRAGMDPNALLEDPNALYHAISEVLGEENARLIFRLMGMEKE